MSIEEANAIAKLTRAIDRLAGALETTNQREASSEPVVTAECWCGKPQIKRSSMASHSCAEGMLAELNDV